MFFIEHSPGLGIVTQIVEINQSYSTVAGLAAVIVGNLPSNQHANRFALIGGLLTTNHKPISQLVM